MKISEALAERKIRCKRSPFFLKIVGSHWGQVGAKNCSLKKAPKILHSGIRVSQVARMLSKKRETNKQTWLTPLGVWKARGCIWLTPLLSHRSRAIEDFLTWKSFFYDHTNKLPKHHEKIILCSNPPLPAALESDFPPVHQLHKNTWPNKRCLITSKSNCSDFKGHIIRNTPLPSKKITYLTYISAYKALSLSLSPVSFFQPSKLVADNAQGCWSHLRKILRCVSMEMHVSGKRARNMKTMFTMLMFKKAA